MPSTTFLGDDEYVVVEADRKASGVGDIVFKTGGLERARIKSDGTSSGLLGGVLPAPAAITAGGFVDPFVSDLYVAGAAQSTPAGATQGIYAQHRVTADTSAGAQDGIAGELRISAITASTFLNGIEASVVVTGGANTIADVRGLTANISTSGAPTGTITSAAIIRTQTVGALPGGLTITTLYGLYVEAQTVGGTNWTVYAPSGNSQIGNMIVQPGAGIKSLAEGFFVRNAGDTGTSVSLVPSGINMTAGTNIATDTVTGTKIGTAITQKFGFFNATPIVQPSAVGTATGYAAGATAVTFHSDDTYTGNVGSTAYTLNGVVAALKNLGLIKS